MRSIIMLGFIIVAICINDEMFSKLDKIYRLHDILAICLFVDIIYFIKKFIPKKR